MRSGVRENFHIGKIRELNNAEKWAREKENQSLKYSSLHKDSEHVRDYTDAAFATNDDLSSQLAYLILFIGGDKNCRFIDFQSRKSQPVVRSVVSGNSIAFTDDLMPFTPITEE